MMELEINKLLVVRSDKVKLEETISRELTFLITDNHQI